MDVGNYYFSRVKQILPLIFEFSKRIKTKTHLTIGMVHEKECIFCKLVLIKLFNGFGYRSLNIIFIKTIDQLIFSSFDSQLFEVRNIFPENSVFLQKLRLWNFYTMLKKRLDCIYNLFITSLIIKKVVYYGTFPVGDVIRRCVDIAY